jgi:MFS family permease
MGVLYGLAFALFYTLLGIPLGRLADRGSRRAIIAIGIAAWSVMTVLCGVARTYEQLLLARFGVAIGEAALAAPACRSSPTTSRRAAARRRSASTRSASISCAGSRTSRAGVLAALDGHAALQWPIVGTIRPWQSVFVIVGLPD